MDMQQAATARDTGMALALDKADRDQEGWSDDAMVAVRSFTAMNQGKSFLTEHLRAWAESAGIVEPAANERAWGAVMRRAAKEGLIQKIGYAPSASSNLSPKTLWFATPI